MTDPRIDGRTKEGRALRAAERMSIDGPDDMTAPESAPARGAMRSQVREPAREGMRAGNVVIGRDGEQLTRTRKSGIDPFQVDQRIIPQGWEYQWCAVSSYGNAEIMRSLMTEYHQNGWRPVPANRHDGLYMPKGDSGNIIVRGQMLCERPKELSDEARREDYNMAVRQMRDRDAALMGGKANIRNNMNNGMSMDTKYRGVGADLRLTIDKSLDAPKPSYQDADDSVA